MATKGGVRRGVKAGLPLAQTGLIGEDTPIAKALSITTIEELLSLYLAFPEEARNLFKRTDWDRMVRQGPRMARYSVSEQDVADARERRASRGTGARPPAKRLLEHAAVLHQEDIALRPGETTERPEIFMDACYSGVRNQGNRGTCVAHAVAAVEECLEHKRQVAHVDLSEQFLYWLSKMNDGFSEDEGTWQRVAVPLVVENGIAEEGVWPYNPKPMPGSEGQGPPPGGWDPTFNNASGHRPLRGIILNPTDVDAITARLDSGVPVSISVPTYKNWDLPSVEREGHIPMPLPGATPNSGHAMCVVGYGYDEDFLGGGYFIVRNSWGTTWAPQSPFTAGYGTLPFSYIRHYGWEAFTLDPGKP